MGRLTLVSVACVGSCWKLCDVSTYIRFNRMLLPLQQSQLRVGRWGLQSVAYSASHLFLHLPFALPRLSLFTISLPTSTTSFRNTMALPSWLPGRITAQQIQAFSTPVRAPKQEPCPQAPPLNGSPLSIKVSLNGAAAASVMSKFAGLLGQFVTGAGSPTNTSGPPTSSQVQAGIPPFAGQTHTPVDLHILIGDHSIPPQSGPP